MTICKLKNCKSICALALAGSSKKKYLRKRVKSIWECDYLQVRELQKHLCLGTGRIPQKKVFEKKSKKWVKSIRECEYLQVRELQKHLCLGTGRLLKKVLEKKSKKWVKSIWECDYLQVRELQKHLCLGTGRLLQLPLGLRDHSHNLAGTSALDQRQVHDRQFFHTFTLWYSCCTSDHSQNFHFLNLEPCLHLWLLRCQRFWIAGSSFDQRQFHDRQFFHTFTLCSLVVLLTTLKTFISETWNLAFICGCSHVRDSRLQGLPEKETLPEALRTRW